MDGGIPAFTISRDSFFTKKFHLLYTRMYTHMYTRIYMRYITYIYILILIYILIFSICIHGPDKLVSLMTEFNNYLPNIKFTYNSNKGGITFLT